MGLGWGVQPKLQTLFVTQENFRNFPGGPGVKTPACSLQGAQVQSLVKNSGSHMHMVQPKTKKKKTEFSIGQDSEDSEQSDAWLKTML